MQINNIYRGSPGGTFTIIGLDGETKRIYVNQNRHTRSKLKPVARAKSPA